MMTIRKDGFLDGLPGLPVEPVSVLGEKYPKVLK